MNTRLTKTRILIIMAIVLGGGVAIGVIKGCPKQPVDVEIATKPQRISEVEAGKAKAVPLGTPRGNVTNQLVKVVDHPPTNKYGCPWHWGPDKKLKPDVISRLDRSKLPIEERIFKNSAERAIAGLLLVEPGEDLIGSDEPSPWFLNSFKRSLETPVTIEANDTDEVKTLKQAVLEMKAELKARMDKGEDIVKIMTDTRRELRELGAYREELQKQIKQYAKKGDITAQDMHDMVDAANIMLEERGAKKIVMPEFYYHHIDYRNQMRKAKERKNEK